MTREEIDVMWSRALSESVKDGEQFTRYHFAGLVLDAAAVEAVKQAVESVKKYADEQTWVQPYAGNRLIHLGWNSADAIRAMKPGVKP